MELDEIKKKEDSVPESLEGSETEDIAPDKAEADTVEAEETEVEAEETEAEVEETEVEVEETELEAEETEVEAEETEVEAEETEVEVEETELEADTAEVEMQEEFGDELATEESAKKDEMTLEESATEEDEEEEEEGKKSYKGLILKILVGIGIVILVIYLVMCVVFTQVFYYGTMIDGKIYSWKQVEDVEEYQEDVVEDYDLLIIQITGEENVLTSDDAGIEYVEGTEIQSILESQNPFLWPTMFWDTFTYETTIEIGYDMETVGEAISGLDFMETWKMTAPTDAYPAVVGDAYEAIPQEYGTELDSDSVVAAVIEAMTSLAPTMNLLETGCYVEADITTESESLIELIDNLNYYATATITYEEGIVCDAATISQWLIINEDNSVSLDEEAITEYVADLAEQFNTVGTTRSFISGSGEKVEVSGGTYGWNVDQEAEVALIIESLTAGEPTEREIEYSRRAITHDDIDWGDTYTEIDLTNQKVYYILEGEVVVEGNVVTGDVSEGNATPQGVYGLTYKTTNAVLRGTLYPDGTYSYESPVSYWMPFNGGIGMHDASWRSSFGGTIYKYNGSHGCVNMGYSTAKAIYSYISSGDPIICHY